MKFKKVMLVTIVLLAVLTIGAVSASQDINTNETLAVEEIGEVSIDASLNDELTGDGDCIIASSNYDEILSDGNSTESNDEPSLNITVGNSTEPSGESYEIIFYEDVVYNNHEDGQTPVVDIIVPEGSNGNIFVTVEGNGWTLDHPLEGLDCRDGIYYLVPDSFSPLDYGDYEITVAYYEGKTTLVEKTGNLVFSDEEFGDDEMLWVNTEDEFSIAQEDLGAIFANVRDPMDPNGNVTFTCDDRVLYNLALSDFDDSRIDQENNIYNIALEVYGEFIFEGLSDGDIIRFALLDEDGNEITNMEYIIFFGDNTVRFEVNAHNPGDHVAIDVRDEVNINDDDDFVWINLPNDITEGKVVVTSGDLTLFEESVNFDEGTHWWLEADDHYVCSFAPNSLTGWDNLNTGDIVTFAFLDENDQVVESKEYVVSFDDDNVRFDEVQQIEVSIWDSNERGTLYTDSQYTDIISVDLPANVEGDIGIIIDGEYVDGWPIEYEPDEDWAHHEWGLMDLGIFDEGDYNITVEHDGNVLREAVLHVAKFNNDEFRVVFILDRARLFCPVNVTGTVRITFEGEDDEGDIYPACDDFVYDITSEDSGKWIEWKAEDMGIELDTYYRVTVNVEDDEGNQLYNLTRWHEFRFYPEDEARLWYVGENEIINYKNSDWAAHNFIRCYHENGQSEIVSIYINNDGWDAVPNMTISFADKPTGFYYISLQNIGITDVGKYSLLVDYNLDEYWDGLSEEINVYEPQINSGVSYTNDFGDHILTIEILPVKKIINGNVWDDYVIEFRGEVENNKGAGSTFFIDFHNGTVRTLSLDDVRQCDDKLGSKELGINKEGEYNITVTCMGNTGLKEVSCSGTIRYLSQVAVGLDMYNLRAENLYIGYGLDDNSYITVRPREGWEYPLEDIEGNVSVYINGKLDKTFDVKSLPWVGNEIDNRNYFIPLSLLSDIPVGNNTITVIYEGNEATVEKSQNFTAVMLTAENFFEHGTIDITENVYSSKVCPVKISFYGNPMNADPLIWGKLVLYVNGEKIDKNITVISEYEDVYGIYEENDPIAIDLMDKIRSNELEDWGYDSFNWLNLVHLLWHCDNIKYLNLEDLNIDCEGTYNITINYFGYDEVWDANSGYVGRGSELRILSQIIDYTSNDTYMDVVITPQNKYAMNDPALINFDLGEAYWNPSTGRTYNNVVVYINDTLAFNDTLVRYTYGDWDGQIKMFGGVSSNCLSYDLLNEYGCMDEGNYHAVVYMENDDGTLREIASGDFAIIKQRGNMSFRVDTSVDLGEHAYLYAYVPQSDMEEYELVLRVDVDFEGIDIDISKIAGKGEVKIDLGVLKKGPHMVYVELAHDINNWDDYLNINKKFYSNYFTVNVIGANVTITPETFGDFFDENGVLTSDADDLIFEGIFTNVTMTINHPVSIIGTDATFIDSSIIIESDDVSIENAELLYTASEDADSYAILANGVSNFVMSNNTILYTGKTNGTYINNAVRITDASSVFIHDNTFLMFLVSAAVPWTEEPAGSLNWVAYPVSEGIVISASRDIKFEDNNVLIEYNNVSGDSDTIYGVSFRNSDNVIASGNVIEVKGHNYIYAVQVSGREFTIVENKISVVSEYYACAITVEGPASGWISNNEIHAKAPTLVYAIYSYGDEMQVSYTENTIEAEGFFIFGIYDDSEEITDNSITLTGNYTVGIAVLSDAVVEGNIITLIASNVGNESTIWEFIPMETAGIAVKANAVIFDNEINSNYKSISLLGGTSTVSENVLKGYVYVACNDNAIFNNIVNATGDYAIDLGDSTGNTVIGNELYANELQSDSAVNGDVLENEIHDNYPLNQTEVTMIVEAADIKEGENQTIEITLPGDALGTVTLSVAGGNFTLYVTDGKASFTLYGLTVGSYEVIATYSGDTIYPAVQNTTTFKVNPSSKKEAHLNITADDITYGEDLIVVVTADGGVNGNVTVICDGMQMNVILVGGTGNATFGGLNAGEYIITANFTGNEEFLEDSANIIVMVNRAESALNVSDVEFVWNTGGTVYVSYTGAVGATAELINQSIIFRAVNNTITISNLVPGNYALNVTTVVDDNHYAVSKIVNVNVLKAASSVAVDVGSQFNVGDEITITLTNSTACTVTINGNAYDVKDGKVTVDSAKLGVGTYVVVANIGEDEFFTGSSANATFTVSLIDTSISVDNETLELVVGDGKAIVAVALPDGLKVNFTTDDVSVVSVDADGNVLALGEGNAVIVVSVGDDVVYKYSSVAVNVTVSKVASEISVAKDSIDLVVGEEFGAPASLIPSAAGNLTYVISDEDVVKIVNGAIVAVGVGNATVTYSFAGNDKYAAAESKIVTVNVGLIPTSISVDNKTLELLVGDGKAIVAVALPEGLKVNFASDDVNVVSVDADGNVLAVGEGNAVIVVSVGDDVVYKYSSVAVNVTVSKVASEISVAKDSIGLVVGEEFGAPASLIPSAAGNLTYVISDEDVVKIVNGAIVAVGVGNATVTYSFAGNDKYAAAESKIVTVNVGLISTSISVDNKTLELLVGDGKAIVAVALPEGLKVNFTTDDVNVVSVDADGNVLALGEGNAVIVVSVGDDVVYKYSSVIVNVTVTKVASEISVAKDSIELNVGDEFGAPASLIPSVAGDLTYVISDENIVKIVNGAIVAVGVGNATVTYSFAGNDKYAAAESKIVTVNVGLIPTSISVDNKTLELLVGDGKAIVAVALPEGLKVNFTTDDISVVSVDADGNVLALGEGNAVIVVSAGDDVVYKYSSVSVNVAVSKIASEISVAKDSIELNVGDEFGAPASLIPSAAGDLTYVISDEGVVKIVNGAIVAVGSGSATVTYSFAGNNKYAAAQSKTVTVTVNKVETPLTNDTFDFDENKPVESKTPAYSINLPSDATGTLTVTVDGINYTAKVENGTATVVLGNLPAGNYDVTVTYSGDSKYSPIVKQSKAAVKVDPKIVAGDLTVQHTAGKYYTVTVYGDDGKVASGVQVTFYLNNKKIKSTKTDKNGVAKFLVSQTPVSNAKVKTVASGKTVTKKLTIKRVVSIKSITVKRTSKKIVLKATLAKVNGKYLVGKYITFKFKGKTFKKVKTKSKGVATLTLTSAKYKDLFNSISKSKKGSKITYSATYSGDTVKKTTKLQ